MTGASIMPCAEPITAEAAWSATETISLAGKSGHGREKGFEALYAFTTVKTVAANHG